MLCLWTSSERRYLDRVVTPVLQSMRERPAARAVEFSPFDLEVPKEGEVHLAMGGKPASVLAEAVVVPRNLSIQKLRGRLWPAGEGKGHWMVTYDPYVVERDPKLVVDLRWDVRLACRYLMTGSLAPRVGTYRWVEGFAELIDGIKRTADQTGERCRVFEDLETLGLYPWYDHAWIISIAFCAEVGTADVMKFPELGNHPTDAVLRQVEWIENADEVSLGGANLKFDNLWKRVKWGLATPGSYNFDTLLAGGLLDENRSNSLNTHAKVYAHGIAGYDDSFNLSNDKGRMDLALAKDPEAFLTYAGGDVDAGTRCRGPIVEELRQDPDLLDFYTTILHPAARAFEKIEYGGMLVDARKLMAVGEEADAEAAAATSEMFALTPVWVKRKRSGATDDQLKFTPAVLREIFFNDKVGWGLTPRVKTDKAPRDGLETDPLKYASTSVDDHLKMFSGHPEAGPFLKALKRKNKAEKIRSSYVGKLKDGRWSKGFLEHLRPDGRFHPSFSLYAGSQYEDDDDTGTVTGRTSATKPHSQTIPKRPKPGDKDWPKLLRSCYPAPAGKLIGEIDVDQGELKIHAMLAQEPTMLDLFRNDLDMHLKTAAELAGITYEEAAALEETDPERWKFIRYSAKAPNFGLIYLQEPPGFQRYAYRQWDLEYTLAEATQIHATFFDTYRMLRRYANLQIQEARENLCVRNPLGRIRHLPLIRSSRREMVARAARQAVNSPTQSLLSDMGLWSIAIADQEGLMDAGLEIFNFVHDAILFYFEDTEAGWGLVWRMKEIMENLPWRSLVDWEPELKMTTTLEVGPNLAELEKVER